MKETEIDITSIVFTNIDIREPDVLGCVRVEQDIIIKGAFFQQVGYLRYSVDQGSKESI